MQLINQVHHPFKGCNPFQKLLERSSHTKVSPKGVQNRCRREGGKPFLENVNKVGDFLLMATLISTVMTVVRIVNKFMRQ